MDSGNLGVGRGFVFCCPSPSSHHRGPGDQDCETASQFKQRRTAVQVSPGQGPALPICPALSKSPETLDGLMIFKPKDYCLAQPGHPKSQTFPLVLTLTVE